jgi:hypothetical protein
MGIMAMEQARRALNIKVRRGTGRASVPWLDPERPLPSQRGAVATTASQRFPLPPVARPSAPYVPAPTTPKPWPRPP